MTPKQEYQIKILIHENEGFSKENFFVCEYSERPMECPETNKMLKAQLYSGIFEISPVHFVVKHPKNRPLKAPKNSGKFGYIILLHGFNSNKDFLNVADLEPMIYEYEFDQYMQKISKLLVADKDIYAVHIPYQVS